MIRPVEQPDVQAIADIYNHYVTQTKVTFEEDPVSTSDMAKRVEAVTAAGLPWLVAEKAHSVIGYAYAAPFHKRSAYRFTVEISAYLAPEATAKGLGTELYDALIPELQTKAYHRVIGVIALPNAASVALHEKFGMEQIAHLSEAGFKFGEWIDVGYWQMKI